MSATAPPKEWPTTTGRSSFSAPIAFASVSALCGSGRIAGPRAVKGDDAKVLAKAIDQRMGEVPHLAAEAVDHDHRRSDALIEDMEAFAIKVKKAALRRHGFLDPPRGDDGKLDEPADHEQGGQKNHRQSRHGCPKIHLRMAMLDTGASRSTGGASLSRSGGGLRRRLRLGDEQPIEFAFDSRGDLIAKEHCEKPEFQLEMKLFGRQRQSA